MCHSRTLNCWAARSSTMLSVTLASGTFAGVTPDRRDQAAVQIAQHVPLIAVDQLAATLAPMPHLPIFHTDAPIRRHAVAQRRRARRQRWSHLGHTPAGRRPDCRPPAAATRGVVSDQRRRACATQPSTVAASPAPRRSAWSRAVGWSQSRSSAAFRLGPSEQVRPGRVGQVRQLPPLLTRNHAQSLAQGVPQKVIGIFDPPSAPQRTSYRARRATGVRQRRPWWPPVRRSAPAGADPGGAPAAGCERRPGCLC